MPKLSRHELAVLGFTVLYMAAWPILALFAENDEFLFYFAVMCVLVVGVALLHLRVRFSILALWGLSLWGLFHLAGGLLPIPESWPTGEASKVLYNWWIIPGYLKYDQLIHAYGFGLVTWICWQALQRIISGDGVNAKPTLGLLTMCVAAGMGFGAANETVEFVATISLPNTNVGGYENTGWDLVANFVGCMSAASAIFVTSKMREK